MQAPSIVNMPEHELMDVLHSDAWHFNLHGMPPQTRGPVRFRLRIGLRDLGIDAEGDVDSLVVPGADYSQARATEVKRVKVPPAAFHTKQPNKLDELTKAVRQANQLADAGFAAVWLSVFVVIDGREQTRGQFMLVPGVFEFLDWTKAAIPTSDLNPDIGIVVSEIVQPVDKPALESGMAGGQMLRGAVLRAQPDSLTDAIARLASWRGAT